MWKVFFADAAAIIFDRYLWCPFTLEHKFQAVHSSFIASIALMIIFVMQFLIWRVGHNISG
jgi:hypothetical protein